MRWMLQVLPLNAFRSQTLMNLAGLLGWQEVGNSVLLMCKAGPSMPNEAIPGIHQDLSRLNGLLLLVGEALTFCMTAMIIEVGETSFACILALPYHASKLHIP